VRRGGRLWGGAIVSELQPQGQSVSVIASGFESLPNRVPLTASQNPAVYQDPLVITRALWTWMQAQPDADLGVELGNETTGGKVQIGTPALPWRMDWWDGRTVGAYIADLASADDGFDYQVVVDVAADGTRTKRLVLGYPRLGRRLTDVRFDSGVNVVANPAETIGWPATDVEVLGAGEGRNMRMTTTGRRGSGYLRNGAIVSLKNEKDPARLAARARAELTARTYAHDVTSLTLRDHPSAQLGSFEVGDDVYASLHSGWTDFDGWMRIMGYQVTQTGQQGQEQIVVDVARAEQFVYGPQPNIDLSTVGGGG